MSNSSEKRPSANSFFEKLKGLIEPTKKICYDTGVFTLSFLKKIPVFLAALFFIIKGFSKKLFHLIGKFFKKLAHPFKALFHKIGCANKAIRVKASAAYKRGGFKAMFKATIRVFKEGIERNYEAAVKLKNYLLPVGGVIILAITVFAFSNLTFGLIVEYDGVTIGCIEKENVFDEAEHQLMQRVIYEEGDDIKIVPKFKLAVVRTDSMLTSDQVTDKLIKASNNVIEEASGLYVDNSLVGAVKSEKELQATLDNILDKYSTGKKGEIVSFIKDVEIKNGLYPISSIMSLDKLKEKINGESASEIIYTVSNGDTPYEVAQKSGVPLDTLYSLNPIIKKTFVPGQKITIASSEPFLSVKVQSKSVVRENVDFETITTKNNNYYRSYRKVTRRGVKGVNEVTYLVTYVNGVPTEKEPISTKVISNPVSEKVTVGTRSTNSFVRDEPSSHGNGRVPGFIWPTHGRISCRWWGYYNHRGLDIAAPRGTPIYAAASGRVIAVRRLYNGYGRHVIIDHGNGVQTLYAHTSAVYVKVGDRVRQGQHIAAIGMTGWATGYHLHFGVMINGVYKNPELFLP